MNYVNSVIKDNNISFEGTEKNNDLLITFTVAEIFRQLCSINDNLTSFTKIPDDHDLEINEEPEQQTSITVGKINTQEININNKDLSTELNNKSDINHTHEDLENIINNKSDKTYVAE